MTALARQRVPANVDVRGEDVTTVHLLPAHYDAVTSISVLFHVELTQVLPRLARALRPGGLLLAVALPKTDLPRDLPIEAWSMMVHLLLGAAFELERMLTGQRRYAHETSVRVMPMQDPVAITRQVLNRPPRCCPT